MAGFSLGTISKFSKRVCALLPDLLESEGVSKATLPSTKCPWSQLPWSAAGLPADFQQALSFEIVTLAALLVQGSMQQEQAVAIARPAGPGSGWTPSRPEWRTG